MAEEDQTQHSGASGDLEGKASRLIHVFLVNRVEEFKTLAELRMKGWMSEAGDRHFERKRNSADNAKNDKRAEKRLYDMMREIGTELDRTTGGALRVTTSSSYAKILDLCMAPGGFLAMALEYNPSCAATAFTLAPDQGGHNVLLPQDDRVSITYQDITWLGEDMDTWTVPENHPDAAHFAPRYFSPGDSFDIIICDGQVLRTHQRALHRENFESARLSLTQLALGLEHLASNGTMIILLHKVESWRSIECIHTFSKFSTIQLFKTTKFHTTRSSFYLIANAVQSRSPESLQAIARWKHLWHLATFGTPEEYINATTPNKDQVSSVLEEFGSEVIRLARPIWEIQAKALSASWWLNR